MIQLSPPLIAGPEQFEEIESILRGVLTEAAATACRCTRAAGDRPAPHRRRTRRMLTVRELLKDLDVRLVAGDGGVDLPVRWVHITELIDPTPWLSGGELLLTTGLQLDTPERQREFVTRLADHHLAGLGFGIGFGHETVPGPLLEAAAAREFPVFEVPYELPFIAITEAAFTQLVNEQYAVLRRALAAQERLERIVLSERGLETLAAALATLLGAAVLVFDSRGEPIMQRAFRRTIDRESVATLKTEIRERTRRREARAFMPPRRGGQSGTGAAGRRRRSPSGRGDRAAARTRGVAGGDQGQRPAV